jgi:HK97 family phage prohead protease
MKEIIFKQAPMGDIIDADEKAGIVKGYASVFDNVDSDGDIIRRGAYTKTIQESGNRVKYLYQHDMDKPIGKMRMLEEDSKGLKFEAEIARTTLGNDVMELIKAGVLTENSVGIMPIRKEMNRENKREIFEVKLYEVSAVTLAANDEAKIMDFKGNVNPDKILDRYDRIAKLLKKGNISDELGFALESEIYKLKSLFQKFTLPTLEVTEPIEVKNNELDFNHIFNYLNQNQNG